MRICIPVVLALACSLTAVEPIVSIVGDTRPGPLATPWLAERGTIRIRVAIPAGTDVRGHGLRLLDARPDGAVEGGPSRLTLHIHGIATWTGPTPALVLLIDDRIGQEAGRNAAFAAVPVVDGEEHEFVATWDIPAKTIGLAMDGLPLPLREARIAKAWQGREPLTSLSIAPRLTLREVHVLPYAIPLILEE